EAAIKPPCRATYIMHLHHPTPAPLRAAPAPGRRCGCANAYTALQNRINAHPVARGNVLRGTSK
ncbi:hypothetical protein ACT3OH_19285, partial [Vreelandella zhanjiangensis]|uniref:hypothetical protein n=1 Tax=Vreelandella zhanjiangensis TaxID=1121960 RepID=UPI00402AF80A